MHAFKYHRPSSVDAASSLAKGEAKLLAGGQSLVQAMKLRLASPSDIIDLGTIKELTGIKTDGKSVTVGAMTRHTEVEHSAEVKKTIPALAALAGMIGDRHDQQGQARGRQVLQRHVRHRSQAGRDHHLGHVPGAEARRLREIQESRV